MDSHNLLSRLATNQAHRRNQHPQNPHIPIYEVNFCKYFASGILTTIGETETTIV